MAYLAFFRTCDGRPVAMNDLCPHRPAPLSVRDLQLGDDL
jgi:phenylpropionate dioxygenase-like ring-hydroxylating dioxygenase large terminal subunit